MRGIKPFKVGMLTRPFEFHRSFKLGVAVLGWSPLAVDGMQPLLPEVEMWQMLGKALGAVPIDLGIPKSRSEMLVTGSAHAPGGKPVTTLPVRARVGPIDKTVYVIGDRQWRKSVPTPPVPFTSMPLSWDRAFGGPNHLPNPLGRGMPGDEPVLLPNLELPGNLVDSPRDKPPPAGFGPLDAMWPQRLSRAGTYDAHWLEHYYPGVAPDIDWRYFQLASDDQHAPEFLRGDEEIEIVNLHPTKPHIRARLPDIRGRAFVHFRGTAMSDLREVPLQLTTVWLLPDCERMLLVWHGAADVNEDDAWDVEHVLVAAEDLATPKPIDHYQRVMALRLQRDVEGALAVLKDSELLPSACDDSISEVVERAREVTTPKGYMQANAKARMQEENEAARAAVAAQGLDPDVYGPPPLPPIPEPRAEELPSLVEHAKEKLAEAAVELERSIATMEGELRAQCAAVEVDYDAVVGADRERSGPPKFDGQRRLEELERTAAEARDAGAPIPSLEAQLADPAFREPLLAADAEILDAYRLGAHMQEGVPRRLSGEVNDQLRAELGEAARRGASLAGRDLTGADLSELDLSGIDLARTFLENASFAGATLRGARFDGAVLAHADLGSADLSGASFREANLGHANLRAARATELDAAEAILDHSDWSGARMTGVRLGGGMANGARFDDAELIGLDASKRIFLRCSFRGARLPDATLAAATFLELDLTDVSLSGADLEKATFYNVRADGLDVTGAMMCNARFVGACSLVGLRASGACLKESFFREVPLALADFTAANLERADFSHCGLEAATLDGAHAREARLVRADLRGASAVGIDLMDAMLSKADLSGTCFRGANLFGADFARVNGDGETDLTDANKTNVRVKPTRQS